MEDRDAEKEGAPGLDLKTFFQKEGIDVFAVVSIEDLPEPDREDVVEFFPAARSVIVFGKEVPVLVYRMPPKDKTREMLRIAESLDDSAVRLAAQLNVEHVMALAVPLYLPIKIAAGRIQGLVRLKHAAVAGKLGSQGRNTVLLTPRFGPRLLLSGVVTARPLFAYGPDDRTGRGVSPDAPLLCSGCDRCVRLCPEGALGPESVDPFRCRTVRAWVPPLLVPTVQWLLGRTVLQKIGAPLAPWIARMATIRCSLCVTECPVFALEEPDKTGAFSAPEQEP
jgi:epoxyqueuosine reductase